MADSPSDGDSEPKSPLSSGIKLLKLARNANEEEQLATTSDAEQAVGQNIVNAVLPPEIKVEVEIKLDAILDDLESEIKPEDANAPTVSSTNHDEVHMQNLSINLDLPTSSTCQPPERSSPKPSQDISISSSRKEPSEQSGIRTRPDSTGEDRYEVSSTTNVTTLPVRRSKYLVSWLRSEKTSPRRKKWIFSCQLCDFSTMCYSTLYNHFKRYHPRIIKSGKLYRHYIKTIGQFIKNKVPTLYACQYCNFITLKLNGYTTHNTRRHPRRKANATKHGSLITTPANRKYLETLYMSENAPLKYKENIRQLLIAYHRDSRVLSKNKGEGSLRRRKPTLSNQKVQKKCILCEEEFDTDRQLSRHYQMIHPEQGPKKNRSNGLYYCKLCPLDAVSRPSLRLHYSRNHSLEAFYAWNVPYLEGHLKRKDSNSKLNATKSLRRKKQLLDERERVLLENLDVFMSISWDVKSSTKQQIAVNRIPCILCDFSNRNIIQLLSHYQKEHDDRYPKGFKAFLLDCLMQHTKSVDLPVSEVHLAYSAQGAWLDEDNHIMQVYKYGCQICSFKCNKFQDVDDHFIKIHPTVKNYAHYVASIKSSSENEHVNALFECQICGYTSNNVGNDMAKHYKQLHAKIPFDPNKLTRPFSLLQKQYFCGLCSYKGSKDSMMWHYAECHDSVMFELDDLRTVSTENKINTFACFACEFSTSRKVDLALHYQHEHVDNALTFTTPLHDDGYQCIICKAITASLKGMIRHHKKHLHEQFTQKKEKDTLNCLYCKHCRRVFAKSKNLWSHITKQHCEVSQLIAIANLPSRVLKYGLWDEVDLNTDGDNDDSDLDVVSKHSQKLLVKKHDRSNSFKGDFSDEDESDPFKCKKCLLNFDTKKEYSQHFCKTTSPNTSRKSARSTEHQARLLEKRVQCKFCPLTTTHHQNLRRHLQAVHRHDVSFRCFKCSDETQSVAECVKHHLYIHGLNIGRPTALNMLLNDIVKVTEGHAKYMCSWCGYKGFSQTFVLNHLNSRHIQSKDRMKEAVNGTRYYCKWCQYHTKNSTSMRAHITMKHNRTLSYHSLRSFQSNDSDRSLDSSDQSDEEYIPTLKDQRRQQIQLSPKKSNFILDEECSFEHDSDVSDSELYRSTHDRCKHQIRYPLLCKFCMRAFVCSTQFLRHCKSDHPHWCGITSDVNKHILVLPDPIAVPHMRKKMQALHERDCSKSVFYNSGWPCEICRNDKFESAVLLQEHIRDVHNGKKIFICSYCEFISFSEKKIFIHSQHHSQKTRSQGSCHQTELEKINSTEEDKDFTKRETLESGNMARFDGVKNGADSDIDVISDNADVEMPDLSSVVFNTDFGNLSPEPQFKRAKKSTWRSHATDRMQTQTLISNLNGRLENHFVRKFTIEKDKTVISKENKEEENLVTGDEVNLHYKHSVCHSGLIRCNKCEFHCSDPERMAAHIKSSHLSTKEYACKFCSFTSDGFMKLDDHLAEFHKIQKNHQLGLHLRFSTENRSVTNEAATQSISEMRSRFLYTPTPCLPIVHERVKYLPLSEDKVTTETEVNDQNVSGHDQTMDKAAIILENEDRPTSSTNANERFNCSYCGHLSESTERLEMHMRRHERNFQQDFGGLDNMSYNMNKMGMVYKFP